jgi:hypothetical protein
MLKVGPDGSPTRKLFIIRGTTREQWVRWFRWRLSLMRGEYWYWGLPVMRTIGGILQRRDDRRELARAEAAGPWIVS